MSVVQKIFLDETLSTLLDTGLNSLANNSRALSSAFDNAAGNASASGKGDGATECDAELVVSYGSAPAAVGIPVWFLRTIDGTNYEDGDASTTPGRSPDVVFPIRAVTGAQRVVQPCVIPPGSFKALLINDTTGQAMASSGNTLKIRPIHIAGVTE